ncbi:MAG: replicative DNA helicase, partial [Candidatus Thermochlorobacter aerophilum]
MSGFIERSQEMSGNYPLQKLTGTRKAFREEIEIKDGRTLPNAVQVEQEVLGGIMISLDAIEQVIAVFGEESDTIFYDQRHRRIYKAMLRL